VNTDTATRARSASRWRTAAWVAAALLALGAVATLTALLTATRPGGPLDPEATTPRGAHALVTLLREHGVDVVAAETFDDVRRAARADGQILVAHTFFMTEEHLRELRELPGDLLVVEPDTAARTELTPRIRRDTHGRVRPEPECDLPAAVRAGTARLGGAETYLPVGGTEVTRCYGGAVVRYRDGGRTVTVLGSGGFLTNAALTEEGNAALAMNLAGARPRLVWYAPQQPEAGRGPGDATLTELIPDRVGWIVLQLVVVVVLVAVWQGRRLGPLVAERLPVVVRASETVEGRGRLYRSRRARDRAAEALRTAALHRLVPRLGLGPAAPPPAVVAAVAARCGHRPDEVGRVLYGPPPESDDDLVTLARVLDDIERQVAQS